MFSSPCCSSEMAVISTMSVSRQQSGVGSKASFSASSATGLRNFRINAPSAASWLVPAHMPCVQKCPQQDCPQQSCPKVTKSDHNYKDKYYQQFSHATARFRSPAKQKKRAKTVLEPASAELAVISPSKFFTPGAGGLDFDEYIEKLMPAAGQLQNQTSQNETTTKSVTPKEKRQSGVKRKLQLSESPGETESTQNMGHGFADKFPESLSARDLVDHGEAEVSGRKRSASIRSLKDLEVRMLRLQFTC